MLESEPMQVSAVADLKDRLKIFLEKHTGSKIVGNTDGALVMLIRHSRTQNTKIKDKFINYKLNAVQTRILDTAAPGERDLVIAEFLIEELEKYVQNHA
ncbi:MAG: hypothetical protein KDK39_10735 [Leptospiraceae bacterium]|nr:hypothetical protein [Leptospiraceae bacterium]